MKLSTIDIEEGLEQLRQDVLELGYEAVADTVIEIFRDGGRLL